MKIQWAVLHLVHTVCLAMSLPNAVITSEEVRDCVLRFEDTHACACTTSDFTAVKLPLPKCIVIQALLLHAL